jgi:hypothetical protein
MDESVYAGRAIEALRDSGAEVAQVFATLAVVELLSDIHTALFDIEARLNEIEKAIDKGTNMLTNEIAAIPSGR